MNWTKDEFRVSDEKEFLDLHYVHDFLSNHSYWAAGIPMDIFRHSVENSICFGLYKDQKQIGFARVVSDLSTIGYLGDVFIDEAFRSQGLATFLMECVFGHSQLQGFRSWMLATRDAQNLYAKFGFVPIENPKRFKRKNDPGVYSRGKPGFNLDSIL